MKKLTYTITDKMKVCFDCPKCKYENKSSAYKDALLYTDILDGVCTSCKTEYTLVRGK